MKHLGISIERESWAVLKDEPLYSARFIHREGSEEVALVVRVEELEWFVDVQPPLTYSLTMWQSTRGTWVAVVTYQLHPSFGGARGGSFYLNPRQAEDAKILRQFSQQEHLCVIFLSEDCGTHYTVNVAQLPQEDTTWQRQLAVSQQPLAEIQSTDEEDRSFALALQELSALLNQS